MIMYIDCKQVKVKIELTQTRISSTQFEDGFVLNN